MRPRTFGKRSTSTWRVNLTRLVDEKETVLICCCMWTIHADTKLCWCGMVTCIGVRVRGGREGRGEAGRVKVGPPGASAREQEAGRGRGRGRDRGRGTGLG